jgi:hypothetical protein
VFRHAYEIQLVLTYRALAGCGIASQAQGVGIRAG